MALPTTNPSDAGVDAQGVIDLLDAASHLELHSIAVARGGRTLARGWWNPYRPDRRHLLYSVSKSVTATTLAALVADGVLGLDDPVLRHLPPASLAGAGDIAEIWRRLTIRHCVTMTVGHTNEAWPSHLGEEPLHTILAHPPTEEPGTVFCYNQVGVYMVARAIERVTGSRLADVARERVLAPLGVSDLEWEVDPQGHALGFTGARMRTDDLLSLVQLWLDGGTRDGQEIVPRSWVEEASRPFLPVAAGSSSDWEQGYGQSFWIARHGYRADGAYGQYGVVLPEQRVAVAITSEVVEMQEVLDLLWEHLLPAVDRAGADGADVELADRLASLAIPALRTTSGPQEHRTWPVDPASDLAPVYTGVHVDAEGTDLTLVRDGVELPIAVGDGVWVDGEITAENRTVPISASGGWTDDGYVAEVRVIETPHSFRISTGPGGAVLRWQQPPLRSSDPMHCGVR